MVAVLRLPVGAKVDEYEAAAAILLASIPELARATVTGPKINRRGVVDVEAISNMLRQTPVLVVLWPNEQTVPGIIAATCDRVVEIDPVRPAHLVAAAKVFSEQVIDLADAKRMLEYPPDLMFAAFRPGRAAADVVRRLAETAVGKGVSAGPTLQEMVGYGEAQSWGLALARDLRDWRKGKIAWTDVDRGLLLSGAPGTGKTTFAAALARTCEAKLIATSVAKWESSGYLSDVLSAMRRSFSDAIAASPAILLVDEIDGISDRNRVFGNAHETYWTQVINLFLELMDGAERLEGVVVVGATNHPERIDPALKRAGRLDRHIHIPLPDLYTRRDLARRYFGETLSDGDLDCIAATTTGFTGADFERAGRDARRAARRTNGTVSIAEALAGLPKPRMIVGSERRMVAIHEAGHAVVGHCLGVAHLQTVAVPYEVREPQPLGYAFFEMDEHKLWDRQGLLNRIALTLAGRAAEEEILGTAFEGAGAAEGADLHVASDIATMIEVRLGMGEGLSFFNLDSVEERDRVRQNNHVVAARVERLLRQEMDRSRAIVREFRRAIEMIADVLVNEAVIDGEGVRRILRENKP
ncbi:AAA family ATPase [Rhizobium oryzicola]|uniref:AAA family ATPase n=1 Tax=Rhizobium oryzicola TaxID=1232668 RepID=A0ABT8SYQ3_9HYPH|nr:AAA family ATPase [Rhizobium oryzicola]MDO1583605.1 AAA family ATPase [Rhizobium oryzicola]